MTRASKKLFCPAATSAATLPSCVALCASIGCPTTSPIAKMCGTLVRIWRSTGMKPRSSTVHAGGRGVDAPAVRHAPDGDQHLAVQLRLRRPLALEA